MRNTYKDKIRQDKNFINVSMPYSLGKSHSNLGTTALEAPSLITLLLLRVIYMKSVHYREWSRLLNRAISTRGKSISDSG